VAFSIFNLTVCSLNLLNIAKSYKLIFFLLGFLLYAKTVNYEFTLDDKLYITQNDFVKEGWGGLAKVWSKDLMEGYDQGRQANLLTGGRYRPLALTIHIIEQELHGNNPFWNHFLNALFYGLLGIVAFLFFGRMFSISGNPEINKWGILAATTIYLLHPLHVEAVANVRNRDEMLSSLLGLSSFVYLFAYLEKGKIPKLLMGALFLLMAYLTKESSINFLIVLGLGLLFLYANLKPNIRQTLAGISAVLISTIVFFALRHWATATPSETEISAELLNNVYLNANPSERAAGILFIYGLGLKLLWWPYPLTHDYYPYHPFKSFESLANNASGYPQLGDVQVILSAVALIIVLVLMLWGVFKASKLFAARIVAFSTALFLGSTLLYSNIFFEIGSFFNERFLFIASLGMALLAGYLIVWLLTKNKAIGITLFAVLSASYAVITWNRISDWRDDETLVLQDVRVSTGSARANLIAAEASLNLHKEGATSREMWLEPRFDSYLQQGVTYGNRALEIYPGYMAPLDILGNLYYEQGEVEKSFDQFMKFYRRKPEERVKNNLLFLAKDQLDNKQFEIAATFYKKLAVVFTSSIDKAEVYGKLGKLYGSGLRQVDSSAFFLEKAIALNPKGEYCENLGVAYAIMGQYQKAQQSFLKAVELGVINRQLLINIGLTYQQGGDITTAQKYFQQAEALKP